MSRPRKKRCVSYWPQVTFFKPAGIPIKMIDEVILTGDEFEAIRLKDLIGLEQIDVAQKMNISRPTIVRILKSAHYKIADALINSKAIKLEKGNNIILQHKYQKRCGRTF